MAEIKHESAPLLSLSPSKSGKASVLRTFGNIIVSIIGTGVLGLPYSFKVSGWAAGILAICLSGMLTYYCMLLLVKTKCELEERGHDQVLTYGDLGKHAYGHIGQTLVDLLVLISQSGCCVSYLIFIGQNMSSIIVGDTGKQPLFIGVLLPLELLLALVRSLAGLAPVSILADVCNLVAMVIVVKDDLRSFRGFHDSIAFNGWASFPFSFSIAVYCYEAFGIALTLEASMRKPRLFPRVLAQAFVPITILYVAFGLVGYLAFHDDTKDIITLNLPNDWSTIAVKLGLCVALFLTFPVMMYPVHELIESRLMRSDRFQRFFADRPKLCRSVLDCIRAIVVVLIALVAFLVPTFGVFISLVGSTVCAMLAFVLPALFHLYVHQDSISVCQKTIDWLLIVTGLSFAIYGTYTTCGNTFG